MPGIDDQVADAGLAEQRPPVRRHRPQPGPVASAGRSRRKTREHFAQPLHQHRASRLGVGPRVEAAELGGAGHAQPAAKPGEAHFALLVDQRDGGRAVPPVHLHGRRIAFHRVDRQAQPKPAAHRCAVAAQAQNLRGPPEGSCHRHVTPATAPRSCTIPSIVVPNRNLTPSRSQTAASDRVNSSSRRSRRRRSRCRRRSRRRPAQGPARQRGIRRGSARAG